MRRKRGRMETGRTQNQENYRKIKRGWLGTNISLHVQINMNEDNTLDVYVTITNISVYVYAAATSLSTIHIKLL